MHTIPIENENRILLTDAATEGPVLWTQQEALVDQNQAILVVRPGQALGNLRAQLGLPTVDIPICQSLITRSRTCRLELPSGRLAVHLERETSGGKPELLLEVPPGSYSAKIDLIYWSQDAIVDVADLTPKERCLERRLRVATGSCEILGCLGVIFANCAFVAAVHSA